MKMKEQESVSKERVSMNIALSPEDKRFLKMYAIEHDTTVAAVIAELVQKLREEKK